MRFKAIWAILPCAFLVGVFLAGGCASMPPEHMALLKAIDASMVNRPPNSDPVRYSFNDEATDEGTFITVRFPESGDASYMPLMYFQENDGRLLVCNDLAEQASPGLERSEKFYVDMGLVDK